MCMYLCVCVYIYVCVYICTYIWRERKINTYKYKNERRNQTLKKDIMFVEELKWNELMLES